MRHSLAWLCVVGELLVVGMAEGQAPKPGTAGPALDKATLAEVRKLQEKRRDVLRDALAKRETLYRNARAGLDEVVKTSNRLLAAELALATTGGERITAHQRHFQYARMWFEVVKVKFDGAKATEADLLEAQAVLLEAEIGLLKAGGKLKKAQK